jgi:hypothetical protein
MVFGHGERICCRSLLCEADLFGGYPLDVVDAKPAPIAIGLAVSSVSPFFDVEVEIDLCFIGP